MEITSVATDYAATLNDDIVTDYYVVINCNIRMNDTILTDFNSIANECSDTSLLNITRPDTSVSTTDVIVSEALLTYTAFFAGLGYTSKLSSTDTSVTDTTLSIATTFCTVSYSQ